ncbi:hypothetical protein [Meiothermus cerbereus]|uniref:hypothetical protein n=1 Tax=Meiothermus cerbereus TaxID=65552 RepID=UPI003EEE3832
MPDAKGIHYLRTNFDSAAIVAALLAVALTDEPGNLEERDLAILAALRRSNSMLEDASLSEIQHYLRGLDEEQIPGLVSNVKGILHEMEFVRIENEDGDSIYASIFDETNHLGTDVQLLDRATGEVWEVQLKATDSASYVTDWIEQHPGGEILVTDELAQKMDLPTSGQSNEELTTNVEDFVDRMLTAKDADDFWDYFPALGVASSTVVVWELWRRHQRGEVSRERFMRLAARATGLKIAKIGAIGLLLSIPVVGQVTGAALVARLLLSAKATWHDARSVIRKAQQGA